VTLATDVTIRASAAAAASGVGDAVDLSEARSVDLLLNITAISGTLTVSVQSAPTETGPWTAVSPVNEDGSPAVFVLASAIGSQRVTYADLQQWTRVSWTLSALGSATFSVTGRSIVVYAGPSDLRRFGLRGEWVDGTSSEVLDAHFRQATDEIDSALAVYWLPELPTAELTGRLPLISWGDDIRGMCCALVAASALTTTGIRPDARSADDTVFARADAARMWLDKVAEGRRKPARMVERPAE
jgi:hypothetical protein